MKTKTIEKPIYHNSFTPEQWERRAQIVLTNSSTITNKFNIPSPPSSQLSSYPSSTTIYSTTTQTFSLAELKESILLKVITYLNEVDVINLSLTSKQIFNRIDILFDEGDYDNEEYLKLNNENVHIRNDCERNARILSVLCPGK